MRMVYIDVLYIDFCALFIPYNIVNGVLLLLFLCTFGCPCCLGPSNARTARRVKSLQKDKDGLSRPGAGGRNSCVVSTVRLCGKKCLCFEDDFDHSLIDSNQVIFYWSKLCEFLFEDR